MESIDQSRGGNLTQDRIRAVFGGDPNANPLIDKDVWKFYSNVTNSPITGSSSGITNNSLSLIHSRMIEGAAVPITLDTGTKISHSVVINSITRKTITKIGGREVIRHIVTVMDPGQGIIRRISRQVLRQVQNQFFIN